jgi:hypothetical protein
MQSLEQQVSTGHDRAEANGLEAAHQLASAQAELSQAKESEAAALQQVASLKQEADSLAQVLTDKWVA